MSRRIVYVWELGAGYGHLTTFLPLAPRLRACGHEIIFILKDLTHAESLLGARGFGFLQAPVHWPVKAKNPPALCYPDLLLNCGFADEEQLASRVKAWQQLLELLQPDLLIFDHAPTALLAAHGSGIPRAVMGTGFFCPPEISPMPSLRPWLGVPRQRLVDSERAVLRVINRVLTRFDRPALDTLAELFRVDEEFLCTFPELDPYAERTEARYWGPRYDTNMGVEASWPTGEGRKIFGYLSTAYPRLDLLVRQLHSLGKSCRFLLHVRGLSAAAVAGYQAPNLTVVPHPVRLADVVKNCDMAIVHAGHGTAAALLLAGKPLLSLPMHLEQLLIARCITRLRAGLLIMPEHKQPDYGSAIKRILSDPGFAKSAARFAQDHDDFDPNDYDQRIIARCQELIARRRSDQAVAPPMNRP